MTQNWAKNVTNADLKITADLERMTSIKYSNSNFMIGAGVVLIMAYIEGQYSKSKWKNANFIAQKNWNLYNEFRNMYKIRNVFAHSSSGLTTKTKAQKFYLFLQSYKKSPPLHIKLKTPLKPYYSVKNNILELDTSAVRRCRSLCLQFKGNFPP